MSQRKWGWLVTAAGGVCAFGGLGTHTFGLFSIGLMAMAVGVIVVAWAGDAR